MEVLIGRDTILDSDVLLDSDALLQGARKMIWRDSLLVDDIIDGRSIASFSVVTINGHETFQKGQPVEIFDGEELEYRGFIEKAEVMIHTDKDLIWDITCTDNHYLADKRIFRGAFENESAEDIVMNIFDNILEAEGIEIGEVSADIDISRAVFNYIPASDAIQAIADKIDYIWYIDKERKLYFRSRDSELAPFEINRSIARKNSIRVESGNPRYRNQQYTRGGKGQTDPQTETFRGDGDRKTFSVGFPVARVPIVEVEVAGTFELQTVGIRGLDEGKEWYWSKGSNEITQDDDSAPLTTGERMRVIYNGQFDILAKTFDEMEIAMREQIEEIGTGIVENVVDDRTADSISAAFETANSKILKYAKISRGLKMQTFEKGLRAGQLVTVDLPDYKMESELLIKSVRFSTINNIPVYEIEAVEGSDYETWTDYFYNIERKADEFVIQENIDEQEILVLLEQYEKDWTEEENPNIFRIVKPSESLFPSEETRPMFRPQDRLKFLAWYVNDVEVGRKQITVQEPPPAEDLGEIVSTTFINASEANVNISHFAWIGGIKSTNQVGTGLEVDKQTYGQQKTQLEAIQVIKTDRRWS